MQKANQSLKILFRLIEEERRVSEVGLPLDGVFGAMTRVFGTLEDRDSPGYGVRRGMKLAVFHLSDMIIEE